MLQNVFSSNNEFFLLTKDSKRLTHIALSSFILPIIFLAIAGVVTHFAIAPLTIGQIENPAPWMRQVFTLVVMFGLGIIVIFLWIKFFEGRKISSLGFQKNGALKKYLLGFLSGILFNVIVVGIIYLFGGIELAEKSANLTGFDAMGIVAIFLIGFLVQGASEEILSRGFMMQVIGARYKPWLGVLLSTALFAILHLGNSGVTVLSVINLILVSLLLALFVLKESSLWFACAWHSSWNWMLGNVFGLSVSGHGENSTIFDLNSVGNETISGGGFGPEGSIITTIVILIGIIIYAIKVNNKKNPTPIIVDEQIDTV